MSLQREYAYYIRISNHMWDDENSPKLFWIACGHHTYTPENNVDFVVWDKLVDEMARTKITMALIDVGDGVQFESHPEISAPDAVSKEFLKKKLDELRARGITPIPKLNFSTTHHCWLKEYRRMVSSQIYRKVCVELIDEVCELFDHPKLFHLGMDEEAQIECQQRRECVIIRGEKLFWEDFHLFFDACRKNGARPWVWGDHYWNRPESFAKNVPQDVMISNWFYEWFKDYPQTDWHYTAIDTYEKLDKLGYDQIPTGSNWSNRFNMQETVSYCSRVIAPERLKGFLCAPWAPVLQENYLYLQDALQRFELARRENNLL